MAGFNNNAEQMSTNPGTAEQYLNAAEAVVTAALRDHRNRIITCDPDQIGQAQCVRQVILPIAKLAFRRPLTGPEQIALLNLTNGAVQAGDSFETAVGLALQGILVAPQFLYRLIEERGEPGQVIALNDYELATRLAYFLWQSGPDTDLLTAAAQGVLTQPGGLQREMGRMLLDPKSDALILGFVDQWLHLGRLAGAAPNPAVFPEFTEELRGAMRQETLRFARHIFQDDVSALGFLDADYTYVNDALAAVYGVARGPGLGHSLTDLSALDRAGILSHPSILTLTSQSGKTSVIRRGVWLLENILCAPPAPPPENAELVLPERGENETLREQLERHRSDPSCGACHASIDPLGFGFEHFDPIGRLRRNDAYGPIDNQGALPDGRPFVGPRQLAGLMTANGDFQKCFSRKLLTYALGRVPGWDDRCAIRDIAQRIEPESGVSEAIEAIITSDAFRLQRNEEAQ